MGYQGLSIGEKTTFLDQGNAGKMGFWEGNGISGNQHWEKMMFLNQGNAGKMGFGEGLKMDYQGIRVVYNGV